MSVSSITATLPLPGKDSRLAEMRHRRKIDAIRCSARHQYAGAILSLISVIGFIILTAVGAFTGYITIVKTSPIIGYGGIAVIQALCWTYVFSFRFLLRRIDAERDYLIRRANREALLRQKRVAERKRQALLRSQARQHDARRSHHPYLVGTLQNSAPGDADSGKFYSERHCTGRHMYGVIR